MKKAYLLLLSGALIIGTFASCNKDEINNANTKTVSENKEKTDGVVVNNGMLKFESKEVFKNVMLSLYTTQRDEALDNWESQFEGYISMRNKANDLKSRYKKGEEDLVSKINSGEFRDLLMLDESDPEIELIDMIIDDHILATVVNEKAMVQIGKDVYKFRYDNLYKVDEENIDNLNNIDSFSRQSLADSGVEISPIKRETYDSYDTASKSMKFSRICGTPHYDPDGNGPAMTRRFRGKRWKTETALTSSLVTKTFHFRRRSWFKGWKESDIPHIYTSAGGFFKRSLDAYNVPLNHKRARDDDYNASNVRYTIDVCFFVTDVGPCLYDDIVITTKHGGTGADGRHYECIIPFR